MPMYDTTDMLDFKKKQKRKRRLIRVVLILLLLTGAVAAYLTQEIWLPKIRNINRQYQTIINDGALAEGNFPITINSGADYQIDYSGNYLTVLSDSTVYFYSDEGGLIKHTQHAYTNPVMISANGRALLYEHGGDEFCLEDGNGTLYEQHYTDRKIMFARLSEEGYTAVVTTSEKYCCEIIVYDRKGTSIYERQCVERVDDISFREGSEGCVISYINAENGSLVTSVLSVDFSENGSLWSSPGLDTFGLEVYSYTGGAFVLGMDACGYVDNAGNITSFYRYDGDYQGGSSSNGQSAVILNNEAQRQYTLVLFDGGGREPIMIGLASPLIDVHVADELAYVMTSDAIFAYDFTGTLRSTAQVNDSYTGFERSQKHIYLKSFNKIDRIDYTS